MKKLFLILLIFPVLLFGWPVLDVADSSDDEYPMTTTTQPITAAPPSYDELISAGAIQPFERPMVNTAIGFNVLMQASTNSSENTRATISEIISAQPQPATNVAVENESTTRSTGLIRGLKRSVSCCATASCCCLKCLAGSICNDGCCCPCMFCGLTCYILFCCKDK